MECEPMKSDSRIKATFWGKNDLQTIWQIVFKKQQNEVIDNVGAEIKYAVSFSISSL